MAQERCKQNHLSISIISLHDTVIKMSNIPHDKGLHSGNCDKATFGTDDVLLHFVAFKLIISRHEVVENIYNTIQYNTIQYNTIQYNTIQYNTIQYNTANDEHT